MPASSGPFRACLFLASSGLFRASPGLFLASSGLSLASSGHFLFIKHCVSSSFSPNSGFLAFWGLFWPLPGLFWLFLASSWPLLASSWPLLASSWPLFGLFLDSPKSPKFRGAQRRHFPFIKHCVWSSFSPNSGFLASSWPLLAFSWPLPGLFWPLPGFFWPLPVLFWPLFGFFLDSPKSPKFRRFQRRHFLFIKHCVSSSFSSNSGFLAFWGLFVRNPAYPVVFGRCAPAASLRLRLGPVEDNDRRRRCPSPRWDA